MGANAHAPAKIFNSIVDALHTSVADALHSIPANCTNACGLITLSHVYRVSCVSKMEATSHLALLKSANLMAGWHRKTKT